MNSLIFVTGSDGCTTSIIGSEAISVIGAKSRIGSNDTFCSAGATAKAKVVTRSVWPSGGALATAAVPIGAAGAGTIVDDHGLRPALGEPLRDQPRDIVGGAAGHERNDELDLLGRIGLRRSRCGDDKDARDNKSAGPN